VLGAHADLVRQRNVAGDEEVGPPQGLSPLEDLARLHVAQDTRLEADLD
jgi:hypothetical protein